MLLKKSDAILWKPLLVLGVVLAHSSLILAQGAGGGSTPHIITTVAGGGPNNVPALQAGIGAPSSIFKDASGNLYAVSDGIDSSVYKVDATGTLTRLAGIGGPGFSGDGGSASSAHLFYPRDASVDTLGNIYIADSANNRIREIVATTGIIQTIVGNGIPGFSGDGGPATSAELNSPTGVFVDGSGNIYIVDSVNNRIREVTAATGVIQTVAGNGTAGFSGDGGPATSAELSFNTPTFNCVACGLFVDGTGNIFIADGGNNRIREVFAATRNIQTVAGNGTAGFSGDGGPATSAELDLPLSVFADSNGDLFIADTLNSRIREIAAATGTIQTVAGNGTLGFGGDGGPATSASLYLPYGVFVDSSGNIFIADNINNRIREVVAATGNIQTVAGNGTFGFGGDAVPATSAELSEPLGIFVDGIGNIFIADTINIRVREVVAATGNIQTVAGNGFAGSAGVATSNSLNLPVGVFVDGSGNIFISDSGNNLIREVVAATGSIQTVAGNGTPGYSGDGGPATSAQLNEPLGVFVDGAGNIFFADYLNHRIREVVAATGNIQTVVGNGTQGFSGDGGPATSATLNSPTGVFVDRSGNIFIADTYNFRVREVVATTGNIQTVTGNGTGGSGGDGGPATAAQLTPFGIFVDRTGNLFVSDPGGNRVREVVAATGNIQSVVGDGTFGFGGDGGPALNAEIATSFGFLPAVWGDQNGNLYLSDPGNSRVRKVTGLVAGPPANITATSGTPQSVGILSAFATPLSVTVSDVSGNAVGGALVTFTAPASAASGTFAGGVNTATTNAAGVATSAVFTANSIRGSYTVTATVAGVSGSAIFNLTNLSTLAINTPTLPPGTVAVAYSATLQATGGTTPYTWSISAGTLPTGLTLNSSTGAITGTPTSAGTSTFTVMVSDSETPPSSQSAGLSINVLGSASIKVQVVPSTATVLTNGTQQFTATVTGTTNTSVTWSLSGAGCSGTACGTISSGGLYTAPATAPSPSTVTVIATSVADSSKSGTATVLVATPPAAPTPPAGTTITPGQSQSVSVNFSGGSGDAGITFNSITCTVTPTGGPTCSLSTSSLTLDQSGNGSVQVTFTAGPRCTSLVVPRSNRPQVPLFAFLIAPLGAAFLLLNAAKRGGGKHAPWRLALLPITVLIMLSIGACSGGQNVQNPPSPPPGSCTVPGNYTAKVTATSQQLGGFQASGVFTVTITP